MKRTISILLILVLFVSLLLHVPTIAKEYPQTRYEAEAAVLSGVQTNTDHAGYTGTGFVDHFDAKGDFVEFSVDLAGSGRLFLPDPVCKRRRVLRFSKGVL